MIKIFFILAIITMILPCSKGENSNIDPWSPWRTTAKPKTSNDFKAGDLIYKSDFDKPPFINWKPENGLNIVTEDESKFLRILPGAELPKFDYSGTEQLQNGFELSFKFRIGNVKNKIRSGQGSLIGLRFNGEKSSVPFRIQAAYMKGSSWHFNGLSMRDNGKIASFEKILIAKGPASTLTGSTIDLKWHEVKIQAMPGTFQIIWDGTLVFKALDNRLGLDSIKMNFNDPTELLGYLDIADVKIKKRHE
jgi:hypothetical protein